MRRAGHGVGLVILAVILGGLPFVVTKYQVDILITLLINVILVVSFRLITTTGRWSLAHIPMMGAGAYATALMTGTLGIPFWVSLPLSGLVAALVALVMSYPLARTKGFAFFIASFAAGEALRLCWTRRISTVPTSCSTTSFRTRERSSRRTNRLRRSICEVKPCGV